MGLYWVSVFRNSVTTIVLSAMYNLIDENDIKQGYVSKDELIAKYGKYITIDDIDDQSYIEDYEVSTIYGYHSYKVAELPVK